MTGNEAGPPRRIGVIGPAEDPLLAKALRTLRRFAAAQDIALFAEAGLRALLPDASPFRPGETDLLLSFGGDGTLLRGARSVAEFHTPVLGVNLGRLGFLTSIAPTELGAALEQIRDGDYSLDVRFTLESLVVDRDGSRGSPYIALNDAVLHKGGFARSVRLRVVVDGEPEEVGAFNADGIILATPTGSTAYNLSAGGPIVVPSVECILATPICPHTLAVRPLVVPATTEITVEVLTPSEEMVLTVDGQEGEVLRPGDRLLVRKGEATVPLVRLPEQSYFSTLRRKLHWGIEKGQRRR